MNSFVDSRHPTRAICPIFETTAQRLGALDRPFAKIEQPPVNNAREIRSGAEQGKLVRVFHAFSILFAARIFLFANRSNNERAQIE